MESRMEKYYRNDVSDYSRSKKNTNLYKEVYGSYDDFEYLPISNNTSEIDMSDLENIVSSREAYQKAKATCEFANSSIKLKDDIVEEEKVKVKERKVYDINELIEKARNENAKAKEMMMDNTKEHNFLETLEVSEESLNRIKEMKNMITDDTVMVKETSVSVSESSTKVDLPLEILSDLKPLGNTVVMEPMKDESKSITEDIPIDSTFIKKGTKELKQEMEESKVAFYSGSYTFSKKDFFDDDIDEDYEPKNDHKFLKIVVLIMGVSLCIAIAYFCIVYFGMRNA